MTSEERRVCPLSALEDASLFLARCFFFSPILLKGAGVEEG